MFFVFSLKVIKIDLSHFGKPVFNFNDRLKFGDLKNTLSFIAFKLSEFDKMTKKNGLTK